MTDPWTVRRIDEIATVVTGATPPSSWANNWGSGVPFLTPTDMSSADYEPSVVRSLSHAAEVRLRTRVVDGPSVAVVCIGTTIGKVALVRTRTLTNQQINTVIPLPGVADGRFLYYRLQLESARFRAVASGSATPIISKSAFSKTTLSMPPLLEQRRIAGVLGALDDLIEGERKNAATADNLWHSIALSATAGAERLALSALGHFTNGKNFTKGATGTGLPVIRTPEVRSGPDTSTVWNTVDAMPENVALDGDILFVWSGSLLVGRWLWGKALINQHIFKVVPKRDVPPWLIYWAIEELMDAFLDVAADKATTLGHIKREDLDRPVSLPSREQWVDLDALIRPLWDEGLAARLQIESLIRTRRELLPLLMSGRVRVSDPATVA